MSATQPGTCAPDGPRACSRGAVLWGVAGAAELAAEQPDLTFAAPVEVLAG